MGDRNGQFLASGSLLAAGRYEIEAVIAAGGFGVTYAARDRATNQRVAIKELLLPSTPSPNTLEAGPDEPTRAVQNLRR